MYQQNYWHRYPLVPTGYAIFAWCTIAQFATLQLMQDAIVRPGVLMPKILEPDKPYSGRRFDCYVVNTTLDADAMDILRRYAPPGRRATGRFLARLLYEHQACEQERHRMKEQIAAAIGAG
jgi:hypothetical protein